MENKSNSLVNLTMLHQNQSYSISKRKSSHSNSLPNLHTNEEDPHNSCCSPCSSPKPVTTPSSPNHKVIPHLLQKTWNKIKSMNSKKTSVMTTVTSVASGISGSGSSTSSNAMLNSIRPINSAPSTPHSLQKFEFDDEELIDDPVRENYAKLQKRLSEELHLGQIQIGKNSHSKSSSGHNNNCVSGEFKKKLMQWEMWKASCGKAHYTDEELKLILPEEFSKKLKEWENIRSGCSSPCQVTNVKIEKQIQWLDKQLEKVELEKGKLEAQMQKFLEKEARLHTMKESLKNYTRDNAIIKIKTATGVESFSPGVDEKFTKKMFEREETKVYGAGREGKKCEKTQEVIVETSTPTVYCRHCELSDFDSTSQLATTFKSNENRLDILIENTGSSSTSSEVQESEDTQEISQEEPEPNTPNTPVSSSSLESINDKASGSNTSNASADFYQKNRRRSSDSTPLSARSPSLSAFTSDDEENGLLKTVEEEAEEKSNIAPTPIVQVNQIVVDDEESDLTYPSNAIVPTKRTLIKPILTETSNTTSSPPSTSTLKDLHSPSLVKCITDSGCTSNVSGVRNTTNCKANHNNQGQGGNVKDNGSGSTSSSSGTSTSPTSKIRVEDIWNKNIDTSPPPGRSFPRIVGVIHKSSSHNLPPLPTTSLSSSSINPPGMGMGMTTSSTTTTITTPTGRNFPRMGKIPLSPLFARRRLASTSSCVSTSTTTAASGNNNYNEMTSIHSLSTSTLSPYNQRPMNNNNEFSLDRFLETSNLSSTVTSRITSEMNNSTANTSNNTEDSPSPLLSRKFESGPLRFISLSRSNSFGLKLPSSRPLEEEEVDSNTLSPAKVCKSKSASSVFKSSLSLFSKVQKSDNSSSASTSKKGTFLGNRWRATPK